MASPPDKGDLGGWVFRQRNLARVSCTVSFSGTTILGFLHSLIKRDDGKVRLILPPWASQLNGFSTLFEAFVIKFCKHMPAHNVCQLMDETAKGPDYITLFVDLYKKAIKRLLTLSQF